MKINGWDVVYKKAIADDGSLLFPERLTQEFLDRARKTMGSYLFANQYQNEIIPLEDQTFKKDWFKYYERLPENLLHFCFIDPAISEADTADYTGIVVVATDINQNWYTKFAKRERLNPSELIDKCFKIFDTFHPQIIGIEDVAFQRAIVHFAHEEMKRRDKHIPVMGVKRGTDRSKETRILSLVPRFEWGSLFLNRGLFDLEKELLDFPRGANDDLIDALSSIQEIVYYPQQPRSRNEPPSPNDPKYESWYISQLAKGRFERTQE
jgi:predicted phage terminase large subunit-like protein